MKYTAMFLVVVLVAGCSPPDPKDPPAQQDPLVEACMRYIHRLGNRAGNELDARCGDEGNFEDAFGLEAVAEVCAAVGGFPDVLRDQPELAGRSCTWRLNCVTDLFEDSCEENSDASFAAGAGIFRYLDCLRSVPCTQTRPVSLEAVPALLDVVTLSPTGSVFLGTGAACVEMESDEIKCLIPVGVVLPVGLELVTLEGRFGIDRTYAIFDCAQIFGTSADALICSD